MKYLILSALLFSSFQSYAADNENILARVEQSMGKVKSIELVETNGGSSDAKLLVRTIMKDSSVNDEDISKIRSTVREITSRLDIEKDPVIKKTSKSVCYMMEHPEPQLMMPKYDSGTKQTAFVTTMTNTSCAFSERMAPKSEVGEHSARILLKLLLDLSSPYHNQ